MKKISFPISKALIQLCESLCITACIAGLVSITTSVTGGMSWHELWIAAVLAMGFSVAHALAAYFKALPSPEQEAIGQALEDATTALEKKTEGV